MIKVIAIVAVLAYMVKTGLAIPKGRLRAEAVRRKGEIARAVVVMMLLGPVIARLLAGLFRLDRRPGAALVLLALVGVVPLASRGGRKAGGDVHYAVLLTATLGVVAAFTAAPTTELLLGYTGPLDVPTADLLLKLVLIQVLPISIGILVRARLSAERTHMLERALSFVVNAGILAVIAAAIVILPRYGAVRSLGWNGALASIAFAILIAIAGYSFAGPDPIDRRTLAGMANMPNVALALVIVESADVDQGFAVACVGVFVVRLFVGLAIQRALARTGRVSPRPA